MNGSDRDSSRTRLLLMGAAIGAGLVRTLLWPRRTSTPPPPTREPEATQALRRLEQRFAAAQRIGRIGTWEMDPENGEVWWSDEVYRIFGVEPNEFEPSFERFLTFVHPDDREKTKSAVDFSLAVRRTIRIEYRIFRPDGSMRWVERRGASVVNADGRTIRILGTLRDITERRRQEQQRRESEARYRLLFERNPLPLLIFDDETLDFVDVNEAAVHKYGWTREEFLRMTIRDIRPADEVPRVLEARRTHQPGYHHVTGDWHHVLKDGTIIDVEIVRHQFEYGGRPVQLALVLDVTAQRRAERALVGAREEAELFAERLQAAIEAERTRISREIHDELGQALTGIRMQAATIESRIQEDTDLRTAAGVMNELLDETVRTVRRISTELRPGVLDAFGLVPAIEWAVQDFTEKCGIGARFEDSLELEPRLSADGDTHVFRIVQEALTNVARHARAKHVSVQLSGTPAGMRLSVTDDGRGFDVAAARFGGSLGLLGMRERARLLGATLEIDSTPGAGTRIVLDVPGAPRTGSDA